MQQNKWKDRVGVKSLLQRPLCKDMIQKDTNCLILASCISFVFRKENTLFQNFAWGVVETHCVSTLGCNWSLLIFAKASCDVGACFSDRFNVGVVIESEVGGKIWMKGPRSSVWAVRERIGWVGQRENQACQSFLHWLCVFLTGWLSVLSHAELDMSIECLSVCVCVYIQYIFV